jgi:acyl-CoA reductase-like NAD-dependent aldehyde dehydrogenase
MSTLKVLSPFDQKPIGSLKMKNEKEALALIKSAHDLFKNRDKWLGPFERISILEKAIELVKSRFDKLVTDAAREGGKPYIDSKVEVERGIEGIKIAIRELTNMKGVEIPMNITNSSAGRMAYTRIEPRGVVLGISAFNHPFNLIIHQVIPAIATGCPIIIKPASSTPFSCKNLVEILYEAGLPKDYCQMIVCESSVAEKMVSDPRISFLSFIGSAKVGWYLRSKLPPGATCALEHGGVAPVIVDKTADISKAIPALIKGGFYHAGQVCVSVQRIFLHKEIEKEFTKKFVEGVKKLKVGDPLDKKTEVGPLISIKEVDRIDSWIKESKGKILCGGKKISNTCYEPTVVLNPSKESKLSTLEVFGPVVCLYSYSNIEEAISQANSLDFAFQASIFSNDLSLTLNAVKKLEGLAVMVNDHTAFRVDWMPFGGYKQSGLGIGGIGPTMKEMSLEKMIVFKYV